MDTNKLGFMELITDSCKLIVDTMPILDIPSDEIEEVVSDMEFEVIKMQIAEANNLSDGYKNETYHFWTLLHNKYNKLYSQLVTF